MVSNAKVAQIVDNGIRLSNNSNSTSKSPPDQNLTSSENGEKSSEKSSSEKFSSAANNKQKYRFISVAQELVMAARGKLVERNWKHNDDSPATIDDISVFVIPILPYKTGKPDFQFLDCFKKCGGISCIDKDEVFFSMLIAIGESDSVKSSL